jgi:ABC-type transport system involved in cytochrome c biogenesis permease component
MQVEQIGVMIVRGPVGHPFADFLGPIVAQALVGIQRRDVVGSVLVLHVVEGPIALGRKALELVNDDIRA